MELPQDADWDFSEFHPLDHWLCSPRCLLLPPYSFKSLYHHIWLSWQLTWKDRIRKLVRKAHE